MKKKESGAITVFLSILLLAVLALILTMVEAVRLKGGYVMADRAFDTAMDSVFAGYYAPLYEEYHIFGLDTGFGTKDAGYSTVTDRLQDYMEYTFNPGRDLEEIPVNLPSSFEPYGIITESVDIAKTQTLLDKKGELFVKQALEYMKYKTLEDGLKSLLEKLKIVKETKETGEILDQKQEAEETSAELESKVLKLMEAIDGFAMKKHGIITDGDKAKITDSFVKKLWAGTIDRNSLGINNDWLFLSVQSHYINPLAGLEVIKGELRELSVCDINQEAANQRLQGLLVKDTSKYTPKKKKKHAEEVKAAKEEIEKYVSEKEVLIEKLSNEGKGLTGTLHSETEAIDKAIKILEEMTPLSEVVKEKTAKYKEAYDKFKNKKVSEGFEHIQGELEITEADTGGALSYDFDGMKSCLSSNRAIIEGYLKQINFLITSDKASWQAFENNLGTYEKCIRSLDFGPLKFFYTGCFKPKDSTSFFSGLNKVMKNGLMELVVKDSDTVSKNIINPSGLPSSIMNTTGMKAENKPAEEFGLDNKQEVYSPVFTVLRDSFDMKETGEDILNNILYMEYLKEHFGDYLKGPKKITRVLSYEKEYILGGEEKDADNLKKLINKIVLLRSLTDTIILLTDEKSREEAGMMAAAFVGFTGMPAIIEAVKYVILVTWGFAEALVDTAAIFRGKSIPLIKQKRDFSLGLTDIFGLTKERISAEAANLKENKGLGSADYETYLDLFLLLKKRESTSYCSMDLIQENLRAEYDDSFSIKNCLAGFKAEGIFKMESRFVDFPFVTKDKELVDGVYRYRIKKEYAY